MEAVCQLARFVEPALGALERLTDELRDLPAVVERLLGELEREDRVYEPLLSAVVQVSPDAPACLVADGDDSRARASELGVQLGVVQRDGQLAGDQPDRVEPLRRERAAEEAVLEHQHGPERPTAQDRHDQQRAAVAIGQVRVAGEAVVAGGIGHDERFPRPPSEFEFGAALAALRAVALDVMVFAGVDPEEARSAVKAGTGRFGCPRLRRQRGGHSGRAGPLRVSRSASGRRDRGPGDRAVESRRWLCGC